LFEASKLLSRQAAAEAKYIIIHFVIQDDLVRVQLDRAA